LENTSGRAMSERVLVVSVHPDDETLGCGGTVLKHVADGLEVHWAVVTQAYEPEWSREVINRKSEEVDQVAKAYSISSLTRLGFPANGLADIKLGEIIESLRTLILEVRPGTVYLVNGQDIHTDHRVVFDAVTVVIKPFHMRKLGIRRILTYETISSTDAAPPEPGRQFVPHVFSDITSFINRKIEIMQLYATEIQPEPLPRSPSAIRALARVRGATIGVEYAEAFSVIKEII